MRHLMTLVLMMYLTHAGSRNQFDKDLEEDALLENLNRMLDEEYDTPASMDTAFHLLSRMDPDGLAAVPVKMVEKLLLSRALEKFRFDEEYLIAIDGTEIYRSKIPHCEKCLTQKHSNGSIDYFHTVLEAKLITPQGMTFSIGSVFIENEVGHYDKQDCELKAFYRLAPKLKAAFPRLAICLLVDSLYANEKVLQICENLNWSYFVAFKEGSIPTLYKEAFKVMDQHPEDHVSVVNQDGNDEIYRWACNLNYKSRTTHLVTADIPEVKRKSKKKSDEQGKLTRFVYLTDKRPSANNVIMYVNSGGRQRSKIEESFNVQKNGGMNLEHNYGAQGDAYKNSYYLLQIAHTLLQFMVNTDMMGKLIRKKHTDDQIVTKATKLSALIAAFRTILMACGTVKNFAVKLGASLQNRPIDDFALGGIFAAKIKLKLIFDTS
jgi:hypothetical protein